MRGHPAAAAPAAAPLPGAADARQRLYAALVAVGLALAAAGTGRALRHVEALRATWPVEADNLYLPSSRTLQLASLGHAEMIADLIAARANVYFGTQIGARAPQKWLDRYLATVIDLDPTFHRVYLAGAAMMVYGHGAIKTENLLAANQLLERGLKAFPYDWELYFQLGFNLLFELPPLAGRGDGRVPKWRQQGIEHLRQAALYEDAPYWLPNLVARMLTRRGSDEMAVKHLEQAYAAASNEETREQIRRRLVALHGRHAAARLAEDRRQWQELVRGRYPYAPDAFSVAAGPRRSRALELGDLPLTAAR